jgi:hypothetical protein
MTVADDGVFFMALKDLVKGFYEFGIFHYRDDWVIQTKKVYDDFKKSSFSW